MPSVRSTIPYGGAEAPAIPYTCPHCIDTHDAHARRFLWGRHRDSAVRVARIHCPIVGRTLFVLSHAEPADPRIAPDA